MKRLDRLILIVATVILGFSAIGLYYFDRLVHVGGDDNYDIIAMTTHISGIVRRRPAQGFTFYALETGDELNNGEYVFTSESADTTLDFVTGTRVKVHENSLIRVKKIDGGVEVEIESDDGGVSGTIGEKDKLKVKTKKDMIELSGEDEPQFEVTTKDGVMEVEAYKKNLKVKRGEKEMNLKSQKVRFDEEEKKEKKLAKKKAPTSGRMKEDFDKKGSESALDNGKAVQVGIVDEYSFKDLELKTINFKTLKTPYPIQNMVFLHKSGGEVLVIPKTNCAANCVLTISLRGQKLFHKSYITDQVPGTMLTIKNKQYGKFHWTFKDHTGEMKGHFNVRERSNFEFNEALRQKQTLEILN